MNDVKSLYELWLANTKENDAVYGELKSIEGKDDEILDRFFKNLEFGTAGLRGVIGAGTNRMNVYTVGQATQGYADFLNSTYKNPTVVIGYDSRINSDVFSLHAAKILAANGVKCYVYPRLMPTPMISYALMALGCQGGIVLTASHNPSKYNGYKVFDPRGYQMTDEAAQKTYEYIQRTDMFTDVKYMEIEDAQKAGLFEYLSEEFIEKYYSLCLARSINPELIKRSDVKIIYTPLNGTGNLPVRAVLDKAGFKNVQVVPQQEKPDGNFPTCPFPNPEIKQVFECGIEMTKNFKADIILATDPDCDRVGTAILSNGEYVLLNGNEMGVLLAEYIFSQRKAQGTLPAQPVLIKSFVSTKQADKVAAKYGAKVYNCLTGFKYIGEHIGAFEKEGTQDNFLLGFEESYGYLVGTHAKDKDGVATALLICEMTAYYKEKGLTLVDVLENICREVGYYATPLYNFAFEGADGMVKMGNIMTSIRDLKPKEIGGYEVEAISDYKTGKITNLKTGEVKDTGLPVSNVLAYDLAGGNAAIVRPSGTEPKIKVYVTGVASEKEASATVADKIAQAMKDILKV